MFSRIMKKNISPDTIKDRKSFYKDMRRLATICVIHVHIVL